MKRQPTRTYARFYYKEFIRDYPHVYEDDAALSAWVRLLVLAESMWPAPADLPRSVRTRTLAKLTAAGLIETDGRTFIVKGLHAERNARSNAARIAATTRWSDAQYEYENEESTKARRDSTPVENGRRPLGLVEPA